MSENVTQNKKLTAKQRAAVEALVGGANYSDAALAAGVTARTLQRWRELPQFDDELRRRGSRAVKDAARQLTGGLAVAVDFLLRILDDKRAPASVRVRAALGIIDRQIRLVEQVEVLERLATLEQVVGNETYKKLSGQPAVPNRGSAAPSSWHSNH